MSKCVVLALMVLLVAGPPAGAAFELRTWATTAAAPADGRSHSTSASFEMVSRLGGPFVGSASSASFALWGCSVTPVEGYVLAAETEPLCVTLRWSVASLAGVAGFNVYRAFRENGAYERVNEELLAASSPCVYEDRTVWPGSDFWYEVRAVMSEGSEEPIGEPVSLRTGGSLTTRLYAAAPNPFSESTVIQHDVASLRGGARLVIYDVAGRVVRTFDEPIERPGRYAVTWDGTNDQGRRVASGVYLVALEVGHVRETGRLVYLR